MVKNFFLSQCKVENYKSLSNVEFKLSLLSIIIGENGTGKTSLLECLKAIGSLSLSDAFTIVSTARDPNKIIRITYGYVGEYEIVPNISFTNENNVDYSFKIYIKNPLFRVSFSSNDNLVEIKLPDKKLYFQSLKQFDDIYITYEINSDPNSWFLASWSDNWKKIIDPEQTLTKPIIQILSDLIKDFFQTLLNTNHLHSFSESSRSSRGGLNVSVYYILNNKINVSV